VKDSNNLAQLYISDNAVTDDAAEAMTTLMTNKSIMNLWIDGNPISGEAIVTILQSLKDNQTLQELFFPNYPPVIKDKIGLIVQESIQWVEIKE